jgi:hypothetical protein
MSKMPQGSVCIIYGLLSEEPIGDIDPLLLIGRGQRLEAFLVSDWLLEKSIFGLLGIINKA